MIAHASHTLNEIKNIHQLRGVLQDMQDMIAEFNKNGDEIESVVTAFTLENMLSDLPTFGGAEPASTLGVYSWSENEFLIYDDTWQVIDRSDY